jgi:hypothetical protein
MIPNNAGVGRRFALFIRGRGAHPWLSHSIDINNTTIPLFAYRRLVFPLGGVAAISYLRTIVPIVLDETRS